MKVCVFHSSLEDSGGLPQPVENTYPQPGAFTDQHSFESRFIDGRSNAQQEIDAAVAEGYDFYFNFLRGSPENPVSGLKASQYFESLGLPSSGIRSRNLSMNKNDFYENARRHGSPPVPGTKTFPLFVKPANGYFSRLIHEKSICHDADELNGALQLINKSLHEAITRHAESLDVEDREAYVGTYRPAGRNTVDVVVQEYIPGLDMTCTVVQMGEGCLALPPAVYTTKDVVSMKEKFLTFELRSDGETNLQLLPREKNPALFEHIQKVAIASFVASGCREGNMGCKVDVRVQPDGAIFVLGVDPQPAAFNPPDMASSQDLPVTHALPGGHRALIDVLMANQLLRSDHSVETMTKLSDQYSGSAASYESTLGTSRVPAMMKQIVDQFDFSGTTFDIACGTGIFGRVLKETQNQNQTASQEECRLLGFDIAPGMLKLCEEFGVYESVHADSMEETLVNFRRYADTVDHVVCFTAIQLLRPEVLSFFLVLAFALTNKSITITVNEVPDAYNDWLAESGYGHMHSTNHSKSLEDFGTPSGWSLTWKHREFAWRSPMTGDDIYSLIYRFERLDGSSRDDLMFSKEEMAD